ncbi:D-alanyl-lipoteichoic acid acyltransferase DltB (MBOAT superfamily) [Angulomicrobium tetraedrale]|uniref:Probable alginate O-acetylase AlgI n=1 Tax=Ancylobacter tetraedralis TaxID=217068 RepID=A0A839Z7X9_9HYPH|nr:MBOAT family protein [Ancylobacter tetraedralis]MBB3770880.1 D-alanyl-lipoteichoic acid acyltransferase DltB (MBOAT superfamily) [Ancylobacter tetraedralis]
MVFSSVTFLFYFLPAFLICYFAVPGVRAKNLVLLAFSLVFYAWGGLANVAVLAVSILANYVFALVIDTRSQPWRLRMLGLAVAANLGGLIAFKYAGFLAENLNVLLEPTGLALPVVHLALPLGISFFTFHAISYLVDVYRGKARANGRFEEIAVYITMFPQLVAGPIVRYSTIAHRIRARRTTLGRVSAGLRIFVIGLSWKVLIADQVAPVVAAVFDNTPAPNLAEAWLGVSAYALQIYFDFGGYSNMAIGLALAMGVKFPRNFNLPYGALSITDFWRRWHMSLSSWFRDYLYIPLGGNRHGHMHTALNLWAVFLLCGLWHGASWTFIIWGVHHGTFLVLERTRLGALLKAGPRLVGHAYVLLVVLSGWVWFRANGLNEAGALFAGLVGLNGTGPLAVSTSALLAPLTIAMLILGWPLSMFGLPQPGARWMAPRLRQALYAVTDTATVALLFALCVLSVAAATYSPFLYFRF